jgi:hypothetical protein
MFISTGRLSHIGLCGSQERRPTLRINFGLSKVVVVKILVEEALQFHALFR